MTFSHVARVLLVLALVTAGGCENTPNRSGVPWWPQGPGNPPGSEPATKEQSAPAAAAKPATQAAEAPKQASAVTAPAPVASGVEAQATRYGDLLFLSGQAAANGGDIARQTHSVMEKIGAILDSHHLTMANVVHVTVQLVNINDMQAMDAAYTSHFRSALPARTVVEVAHLPGDALVQITIVAGR